MSASNGPKYVCDIENTAHITAANIGSPSHLWANILSALSWSLILSSVLFLFSTLATIPLTKSYLFLSFSSTSFLFDKSIPCPSKGAFWLFPLTSIAFFIRDSIPLLLVAIETVSTIEHPKSFSKALISILVPCFLFKSVLFNAITTGISNSNNWVVKNKLLLKFVPSTIFIITFGFSF